MSLSVFSEHRWTRDKDHERYRDSILVPVAPEWATGEVLLSGAYRKLLLGVSESGVDRRRLEDLPSQLGRLPLWDELFTNPSGLQSPPSRKEKLGLKQLMPYVPEISRYAGVLGQPRNRWDPGNLLLTTLASGCPPAEFEARRQSLATALDVDQGDDVFARFVEHSLRGVPGVEPRTAADQTARRPAWRARRGGLLTPSERFAQDLESGIALKAVVTRRQWTVAIEALLRLGLAAHVLWLCRLNGTVWSYARRAVEGQDVPAIQEVEDACWLSHQRDPLLALGFGATALIRQAIQSFVEARIGLSLLLHALEDIGRPWPEQLGDGDSPSSGIHRFLDHCRNHRIAVQAAVGGQFDGRPLATAAAAVADSNQELVRGDDGFANNVSEFVRYSLSQLQPRDPELQSYDQSYFLHKRTNANNAPWIVQPGPTTLIVLVSACCRSVQDAPSNIDDLKQHLADYGIHASAGELQDGRVARDLELLGLVIDSPDAAGGRLLVDPFGA